MELTVFHQFRHSERKSQSHQGHENHRVLKQGERRDWDRFISVSIRYPGAPTSRHSPLGCPVLTFRSFLVKSPPCQQLGFHSHIAHRGGGGRVDDKLLSPTIVPWIPAKCFPDSQHGAVGGDVDAVGGKDVFSTPDIEQVGLGLGGGQGPENEGRGASQ